MRVVRLALRLGLFQLSLGILGVLMLGLCNRLLIAEIGLPAAVVAFAWVSAADGVHQGLVW